MNTEVEGALTLLWNTIDGEYRYFSKKGNDIVELKNTKQDGDYQEEYKKTLQQQTSDAAVSTEKVKLTLPSLHAFFVTYNKKKDPNFSETEKSIDLQFRLGAFAGVGNSVYTENPTNELQPIAIVIELPFQICKKPKVRCFYKHQICGIDVFKQRIYRYSFWRIRHGE